MKAFREWYEKEVGPIDFPGIKEAYEARKKTWRAALEMVLKSQNLHLKSILIQEIKKELEE